MRKIFWIFLIIIPSFQGEEGEDTSGNQAGGNLDEKNKMKIEDFTIDPSKPYHVEVTLKKDKYFIIDFENLQRVKSIQMKSISLESEYK